MSDPLLQGRVVQRPPDIGTVGENALGRRVYDKAYNLGEPVDIHKKGILRDLCQPVGIMFPDSRENRVVLLQGVVCVLQRIDGEFDVADGHQYGFPLQSLFFFVLQITGRTESHYDAQQRTEKIGGKVRPPLAIEKMLHV